MILKLFKDFAGYSWSRNFGWIGQGLAKGRLEVEVFEASPSVYDGIIARRTGSDNIANVLRLDLAGVGCMGELPDSLSVMEECTFLCLNWNLIFGNLPSQFGNMTKLMHLDLSGNGLSGTLDVESFTQFTALRTLNLSFNAFDGPIPDAFHRMTKLTILNLSGNCLSGELPPSLSRLVELQELKLYSNKLIGVIPSTMSALQNLEKVNLSQNRYAVFVLMHLFVLYFRHILDL
jgi:Leucine-rich repeat (LRR) protein